MKDLNSLNRLSKLIKDHFDSQEGFFINVQTKGHVGGLTETLITLSVPGTGVHRSVSVISKAPWGMALTPPYLKVRISNYYLLHNGKMLPTQAEPTLAPTAFQWPIDEWDTVEDLAKDLITRIDGCVLHMSSDKPRGVRKPCETCPYQLRCITEAR